MRRLITYADFRARGLSREAIRWGEHKGSWTRIVHGVYGTGPEPPSVLDRSRALVLARDGVASGLVAGELQRLDSVMADGADVSVPPTSSARGRGIRRRHLPAERVTRVHGVRCVDALQTLVDIAPLVDDLVWEQALESALRKSLTTIEEVERASQGTYRGVTRVRRVLGLRPTGAAPTESLLETLMVQLIRLVHGLPDPVRQYVVVNEYGEFVARVDLCWPELGLFLELDGQHHKGQPVYDARRETAVVAATGWLCGRFTWDEVVRHPAATARRLTALAAQARRRPMPGSVL